MADRRILEHVEPTIRASGTDEGAAIVALLALDAVAFDAAGAAAAVRRALLILAAGGDPHRELTFDDRAVETLAADLDDPARRAELEAALRRLREQARGLAATVGAVDALLRDPERAWRALAAALLADELSE